MWAVERDPALRSDFCNLTIVEGSPDQARIDQTIDRAIAAVPRLAQRVVDTPLHLAPPEFTDIADFDPAFHVHRITIDSPGDERSLLDLCAVCSE